MQGTDNLKMTFILDPTALPAMDHLITSYGIQVLDLVCHMTMTYAYGLHRKKLIITGRWPYAIVNENCVPNTEQINDILISGSAVCQWRPQLSDVTSYTTAQYPVHARQTSLISDPTSTVTASQCSAYGCIGAHIPTVIDTAIVAAVGPCEGGEPGVQYGVLTWTIILGWVCVAVGLGPLVVTRAIIPHIIVI